MMTDHVREPLDGPNDGGGAQGPRGAASPELGEIEDRRRGESWIRLRSVNAPATPTIVKVLFGLLFTGLAAQVAHELFRVGGSGLNQLIDTQLHDTLMVGAAVMCGWRAATFVRERVAWALMAASPASYAVGDIIYTGANLSFADVFYLGYFPFVFAGLAMLVKARISTFDLHRWIDGIAVALLVATPGVALVLQPTYDASHDSSLAKLVSVAYPLGDIIVLGAAVGVIALAGWRPGRAWLALSAGTVLFVWADSLYAVQNLNGTYQQGHFDFLWPAAALMVALSAWSRPVVHEEVHHWGWSAVALPIACQVVAIAVQIYAYFFGIPESERVLTVAVLAIVVVQLVTTRPLTPWQGDH